MKGQRRAAFSMTSGAIGDVQERRTHPERLAWIEGRIGRGGVSQTAITMVRLFIARGHAGRSRGFHKRGCGPDDFDAQD
jgi:hypothetical protein